MNGKPITSLLIIVILLALGMATAGQAQTNLEGRVYEGQTGAEPPTAIPIQGVTVSLYGSNDQNDDGTGNLPIQTTTTNPEGWYSLTVRGAYDFYNIVQTNRTGYVDSDPSPAARSVGGAVKSSNWIQYRYEDIFVTPVTMTGNKFWDKKSQPPEEYDFGDAPDPNYPTLRAQNGAQHTLATRFYLGTKIDAELDGQPHPQAMGDDNSNIADEDGVVFAASLIAGKQYTVQVTVTAPVEGVLDAWVDFNRDGDWADAGEQIFTALKVPQGINNLTFMVPATADPGLSFARFRLSEGGVPSYTGSGGPGEVEDYLVEIDVQPEQLDFGDAPAPYPGASHTPGQVWLGFAGPDTEAGTQASPLADGDDNNGIDDEDGFSLMWDLVPGQLTYLAMLLSGSNQATGAVWIDYNRNGNWEHPAELFVSGSVSLPVPGPSLCYGGYIPTNAQIGTTYARVRVYPGLNVPVSPTGDAQGGEVEDYQVEIKQTGEVQPPGHMITGIKFDDLDGDRMWDPLDGEARLPNWVIWLDTNNDGTADQTTTTDNQGGFEFTGLNPGTYTFGEQQEADWTQTAPGGAGTYTVTIPGGPQPTVSFAMFGNRREAGLDYGDAPSSYWAGAAGSVGSLALMGSRVDGEASAQTHPHALGDDLDGNDDEDGVTFLTPLIPGQIATVTVDLTHAISPYTMSLAVWIDFDRSGVWDPTDLVFNGAVSGGVVKTLTFTVPWTAKPGQSFARFHIVDGGPVPPWGVPYGEVEDYEILIGQGGPYPPTVDIYDFGDAPDPTYPTRLVSNGARHRIDPSMYLGSSIDPEVDGQPTSTADGDNTHGANDEDGITIVPSMPRPGEPVEVRVIASNAGVLNAWIDFNIDGDWKDPGEHFIAAQPVVPGMNAFALVFPANAQPGQSFARFRFSSERDIGFDGEAPDGEVEDYPVEINSGGLQPPAPRPPMGHPKWSQPPVEIGRDGGIPIYSGWNEPSTTLEVESGIWFDCWNCPTQCHGDADCDGDIDQDDILELQSAFSWKKWQVPYNPCADLNRDMGVSLPDFYIQMASFHAGGPLLADCPGRPVFQQVLADDWLCQDERAVTDIHWWCSFVGWTNQHRLPPVVPEGFHLGIWTNVAEGEDNPFSHPGSLIWENMCTKWTWRFDGYDLDPRTEGSEKEACFEFTQLLSQDEWFKPDLDALGTPKIYWLSITPIYQEAMSTVEHPWGWKTRPHFFNDDAVRILESVSPVAGVPQGETYPLSPPAIGAQWVSGEPIVWGGQSWDMAFELTSNEPDPDKPSRADLNWDGIVDFKDLALLVRWWLTPDP